MNSPAALIVPRDVLQVGVTDVVELSLHVAVAVYEPVPPSPRRAAHRDRKRRVSDGRGRRGHDRRDAAPSGHRLT
ncbi:MAG: hypothetical protein NCA08_02005 [Deltaproteobacteria bacterium]|nr:hypothetical protein [Candidatus Deferrimicrobium borealis]